MISRENIKQELVNYQPTDEERLVIRSAVFNFVTMATIGAAALGMSASLWSKSPSAKPKTAIPTILGTFTGLTLGGILGMDRGMRQLRESLPVNSHLLTLIHENDQLKKETLLNGPTDLLSKEK
ncbi:uncharacterized protein B0P05DRAFT_481300 [Gilbertella persicaria]|uniref:uncharacterized protein n=1 Tax=Gilbertella persicaria TaxID=101096 RepID=UPI002220C247|nr:uncharacterized protein B0P05DRAFT_481300 [Gilbertella persicaria]KAI8047807.1 hypothetical protein B0P05DRAFT_481300 [Gilbertella persicaria]